MKTDKSPGPWRERVNSGDIALWAAGLNVPVSIVWVIASVLITQRVSRSVAELVLATAVLPSLVTFSLGIRAIIDGIRRRSIATVLKGLITDVGAFLFGVYALLMAAWTALGD